MKQQELSTLKNGEHFIYGDVEWVKLDSLINKNNEFEILAIAANNEFELLSFNDSNSRYWSQSHIRILLNNQFLRNLISSGADSTSFMKFEVNLTTLIEEIQYEIVQDIISLLTWDSYCKYMDLIPKIRDSWWLATAWSCNDLFYDSVCFVQSNGRITYSAARYTNGVRPICHLKPSTIVFVS